MKCEEAETIAECAMGAILGGVTDWCEATAGEVAAAILSAYRQGAEDMRERAASAVGNWRWGNHDDDCTVSAHPPLVAMIRALPLTPDPEDSNEQVRIGDQVRKSLVTRLAKLEQQNRALRKSRKSLRLRFKAWLRRLRWRSTTR